MKQVAANFLIILLAAISVGCAKLRVETDYKPGADFSVYQSFAWYDKTRAPKTGDVINTLFDERVRSAIQDTLIVKGYRQQKSGSDFLVTYHFSVEKKLESRDVTFGLGYGPYGWGWGAGVSTGNRIREYDEGTLMIDLLSPDGKELLWRGYVQRRLYGDKTPEQREADIQEVVSAILAKFPPQK